MVRTPIIKAEMASQLPTNSDARTRPRAQVAFQGRISNQSDPVAGIRALATWLTWA